MLLELTIWSVGKYLLRLTKKFGIEWLNKNLKMDKELSALLYDTANSPDNPDKFGDLLYYLYKNKGSIETIKNEIPTIESLPEVKKEPNLLLVGAKLETYQDLLEEVFQIVALRRHPIVLEGFLHGSEYISYYHPRYSSYKNFKITKDKDCLRLNSNAEIKVEKITDSTKRQERIKKQRTLSEEKRSKNQYDSLKKPHYRVI